MSERVSVCECLCHDAGLNGEPPDERPQAHVGVRNVAGGKEFLWCLDCAIHTLTSLRAVKQGTDKARARARKEANR